MEALTDKSRMPWGKWKGTQMANVPADYLLWLYREWTGEQKNISVDEQVKAYIEDNMDVLKEEVKE